MPDGLVLTDGRRVAVEVELTVKSRSRIRTILDEITASNDAVIYFCAPPAHRVLTALAEGGRWPTLGIRPLPSTDATP